MTHAELETIAQLAQELAVYHDVPGLTIELEDKTIWVTRGDYFNAKGERVGLTCKNKNTYVVNYAADPATARETFRRGTILGQPKHVDEILDSIPKGDPLPFVVSHRSGTYYFVRTTFDRVLTIFFEKIAN